MTKYYKEVRLDNHRSWYDDRTEWIPGKITRLEPWECRDNESDYPPGLYCSHNSVFGIFGLNYPSAFYRVEPVKILSRYPDEQMVRCAAIKTLYLVPREELNKVAGFNLWDYHNSLTVPSFATPCNELPIAAWAHHINYLGMKGVLAYNSIAPFIKKRFNKMLSYMLRIYADRYYELMTHSYYHDIPEKYRGALNLLQAGDYFYAIYHIRSLEYFPEMRQVFAEQFTEEVDLVLSLVKLWNNGYFPYFTGNKLNIYRWKDLKLVYTTSKMR